MKKHRGIYLMIHMNLSIVRIQFQIYYHISKYLHNNNTLTHNSVTNFDKALSDDNNSEPLRRIWIYNNILTFCAPLLCIGFIRWKWQLININTYRSETFIVGFLHVYTMATDSKIISEEILMVSLSVDVVKKWWVLRIIPIWFCEKFSNAFLMEFSWGKYSYIVFMMS